MDYIPCLNETSKRKLPNLATVLLPEFLYSAIFSTSSLPWHSNSSYLIAISKNVINESIFISFGVHNPTFVCPCHSTVCHLTTTRPTHRNGLYLSGTLKPFIISPYFQVCQECRNCFFLNRRSYIYYSLSEQNQPHTKPASRCGSPRSVSEMDVRQHKLLLTEIVCLWHNGFLSSGVNLFDLCCYVQHLY